MGKFAVPRKRVGLRGLTSGRLVVTALSDRVYGSSRYWWCLCTCGNRVEVRDSCLTTAKTKSCGCITKEILSARNYKHGMGNTPAAAVWRAMIARCHAPQSRTYHYYGGRGISVCERWRSSFEDFLADMGECPANHQLDRIDNNGDYCPENCHWVTCKENQRNRGNNVNLTFRGETKNLAEWAEITGIKYGTLWKRVKDGWNAERVLTTPTR